jgi:hypothetical protein
VIKDSYGHFDLDKERKIKIYNPDIPKSTEIFSYFSPKTLLGAIINYFKDNTLNLKISPNTYKITM